MGFINPETILPLALAFVAGITIHEFAHAFIAYQMGDMTPMQQGRVTLNPLAHLTLWGTLLIFLIGFGWGKPVQHRIYDIRRRLWVALAGPVSNLILAALAALVLRSGLLPSAGPTWLNVDGVLFFMIWINVLLAVFNLLPLSPLDGATVFAGILPDPFGPRLAEYNARYPQALILFLLVDMLLVSRVLGQSLLWTVLGPPIDGLMGLLL